MERFLLVDVLSPRFLAFFNALREAAPCRLCSLRRRRRTENKSCSTVAVKLKAASYVESCAACIFSFIFLPRRIQLAPVCSSVVSGSSPVMFSENGRTPDRRGTFITTSCSHIPRQFLPSPGETDGNALRLGHLDVLDSILVGTATITNKQTNKKRGEQQTHRSNKLRDNGVIGSERHNHHHH